MKELINLPTFKKFIDEVKEARKDANDHYKECRNEKDFFINQGFIAALDKVLSLPEKIEEEEEE